MDAFEFAMKMELDGIRLYEEVKSMTPNKGVRSILDMLISQEKQHFEMFEYMKRSTDIDMKKVSFKGIKNMFEQIKSSGEILPEEQLELYLRILKVEEDAEKVYKEMAEKIEESSVKEQIIMIAGEEHRHQSIIQNIIDMITQPDRWVESAEINHLEEY